MPRSSSFMIIPDLHYHGNTEMIYMWLQAQVAAIKNTNILKNMKLKRELFDVPNATMQYFYDYPRSA